MVLDIVDGFPSGQRGQTVNLLAPPSKVQILPHPPSNFFHISIFYFPHIFLFGCVEMRNFRRGEKSLMILN